MKHLPFAAALISLIGILFLHACSPTQHIDKMEIVQDVDLQRYAGTWYEIARFPHRFEKDLVGVTATYNLLENGRIEVINQGYKHSLDGPLKRAVGKAKVPDPEMGGHLKVSFFWFFYADYFILELDSEHYQYALIGSSTDRFLWILGREPAMDENTYQMLVARAEKLGYDISMLERVPQRI